MKNDLAVPLCPYDFYSSVWLLSTDTTSQGRRGFTSEVKLRKGSF